MAKGKKKDIDAFLQSEGYKTYSDFSNRPEMQANGITSWGHKCGLSFDEAYELMQAAKHPDDLSIQDYFSAKGEEYPEGFPKSNFSKNEIEHRKELAKQAEYTFFKNHFDIQEIYYDIDEYAESGEISQAEAMGLKGSRDLLRCVLNIPKNEEDKKKNLVALKKYLGHNLDKSNMSEAEYKDQLLKQKAEIINDRLRKFVHYDYKKFKNLTEEQLVENWGELFEFGYNMSTFKKEIGDMMDPKQTKNPNPYIDRNLYTRFADIDEDFGDLYYLNSCKMNAIINPYYPSMDIDSVLEVASFPDEIEYISDDPYLKIFVGELGSIRDVSQTTLGTQIAQEFNKNLNIKRFADGITFYDKQGNKLWTFDIISRIKRDGGVIAVPNDHAGMMTVFGYDSKTQKMTMPDPQPFTKTMDDLKKTLRDIDAENAAKDEIVENNIDIIGLMNISATDIFNNSSKIAIAINKYGGDDLAKLEQFEKDTKDYLKRHYVPMRPQLSYDEFTKLINVPDKDIIGTEIINERLALSSRAAEKLVDAELRRVQAIQVPQEVDDLIEQLGLNARVLKSVLCKYGKENQELNQNRILEFLDLDEDFHKRLTNPKVLKEKQIAILNERFKELDEIKAQLVNQTFDDKGIVDNLELIHEYGIAHGMEIRGFLKELSQVYGIDTEKDLGINVSEFEKDAYDYNDIVRLRAAYISSPLYQFGAEETIFSDEANAKLNSIEDVNVKRTAASVFNVKIQNASTLKNKAIKAANIDISQIDFMMDSNGKDLGDSLMNMGYALAAKKDVRIYLKGQANPISVSCKDLYKLPVEIENRELTPAEKSITVMDRVEHKLSLIAQDRTLNPEQKELASDLVESEYEIGVILGSLKGLEGERLAANRDGLERAFTKYLVNLTISKMIEKENPGPDVIKGLISQETKKGLQAQLHKLGGISELMEKTNLENIDSEKLWKDFVEMQKLKASEKVAAEKAANDIKYEKYKETIANSKVRINGIHNITSLNLQEHWGLNRETCEAINTATKLALLSVDRASLQTIAFSLMLNDGKSLDSIISSSDENLELRGQYTRQAIDLVYNNKADEIGQNLFEAMKKVNQILKPVLDNGKPFTVDDMFAPENSQVMAVTSVLKDLQQELRSVSRYTTIQFDAEEMDKVTTSINAYTNVLSNTKSSISTVVKNVEQVQQKKLGIAPAYITALSSVLQYAAYNACRSAYQSLPGNENKSISELSDETYLTTQYAAYVKSIDNKYIQEINDKVNKDPVYAQKALASLLDGSFEKALNFKIELGPELGDDFKMSIDHEALKKCIEERFIADPDKLIDKPKPAEKKEEQIEAAGPQLVH